MKVAVWTCQNCGHEVPITENMEGLTFKWLGERASMVSCQACGSCTIQRADDDSFTVGDFLVIRTKNKIKGKGYDNGKHSRRLNSKATV